ncbi:MAG: putative glycerophosphoryl diester phosphodiesterase 1 [Candidatus Hydrogenedentota bacterium]
MLIQHQIFHFVLSFSALAAFSNVALAETTLPLPRHADVYVVAHRGAHDGIPENTLAAYSRAIELGCDFVEIDVRTTKDGHLVSVHNATIDAYAPGQSGKVKEMNLAELQALDIGSRVHERWRQERIPTLEEVFALCSGKIGIYLDMKDAQTDVVLRLVRAHGMENSCIWYASPKQLREVAAMCPECLPMPDPGPEKLLPRMLESFKPSIVASSFEQLSKAFVDTCHAAGAIVIVDESDASSWKPMLEWNVDGIQTDDPAGLIAFLDGRQKEK